jgi:hypothetical protein
MHNKQNSGIMDNPNLNLPEKNNFDDQAESFSKSRHYRRLQHKYREEPYEEAFRPLYIMAQGASFFANALAIVTGFAFVFGFLFAMVAQLPYPAAISSFISLVFLLGLEIIQRFLGSRYFRYFYQYGYKGPYAGRLHGLLIGMIVAGAISTYISYSGGFTFTEYASTKPTKATAPQKDLTAIDADFDPLINAAAQEADTYRRSKLWKGKLSDKDASKYNALLAEKNQLVQQKLAAKSQASSWNETQLLRADSTFTADLGSWEQDISRKGTNLGHFTIFFILLLHLCMWYMEYFDYRTAIQYAQAEGKAKATQQQSATAHSSPTPPSVPATDPRFDRLESLLLQALQSNPKIQPPDLKPGISPTPEPSSNGVHPHGLSRTVIQGFRQPESPLSPTPSLDVVVQDTCPVLEHVSTNNLELLDIFTILHHDRNSAEPKRYSLREVENFISTYEARLKEAHEQGKKAAVIRNRAQRLDYWKGRKAELLEKMKGYEECPLG